MNPASKARPPVERVALALTWMATIWFFGTALWGIDATPGGGHLGSSGAATSMFGEHMIRWHTFYPLWDWYALVQPPLDHAYCHHPFGVHWAAAVCAWFFPHRDFVIALPALFMSTATPPLLYGIGRRIGGPLAGAAAAIGFVVLPIAVGYSCFASLEVMVIFGVVLFFWGHLAHLESGRGGHLAWSLVGLLFACFGDWAGYLIVAPLLGWALLRAHVLPASLTPPIRASYHRWWALSVSVAVLTLVVTVGLFKHADKLSDWLASADSRGGAETIPLAQVLQSRASWIEFSFTPFAILIGKLALPIVVARFVVRRRDEEILSLAVLFGATAQYVGFKQGADVHIFWPHYFALYFALGMAQIAALARDVTLYASKRFQATHGPRWAVIATIVLAILPSLALFPDAYRSLRIWRETGGRFNDKGALFRSHVDINWLLAEIVRPNLHPGEIVGVHPGTQWGWEHQWAIEGVGQTVDQPSASYPFWIARASGMGADEMKALATAHHLRFYGDVILIAREDLAPAPLDAYSLHEREPGVFNGFLRYNTEPVRSLDGAPDPFLTWEWRDHLGQPATFPDRPPSSLDEQRIAHNAAIARGDGAAAEALREGIERAIDRTHTARFSGDHRMIGIRLTHGVKPTLEIWFEAAGPTPGDTTFSVRSIVDAPKRASFIPLDPTEREMAFPPSLSSKLWKKGYLYHVDVELKHRVGTERYYGSFVSRDGSPAPIVVGVPRLDLVILQ
ncbi:hypothetical protein BH09MYX1_BH09MYX1_31310 [soil metagenome]